MAISCSRSHFLVSSYGSPSIIFISNLCVNNCVKSALLPRRIIWTNLSLASPKACRGSFSSLIFFIICLYNTLDNPLCAVFGVITPQVWHWFITIDVDMAIFLYVKKNYSKLSNYSEQFLHNLSVKSLRFTGMRHSLHNSILSSASLRAWSSKVRGRLEGPEGVLLVVSCCKTKSSYSSWSA